MANYDSLTNLFEEEIAEEEADVSDGNNNSGSAVRHSSGNDSSSGNNIRNSDSTDDNIRSNGRSETQTIEVEATAYVATCEGCSGITYSGYDVRNTIYSEKGRRIIATDPSVIETGTVVAITFEDGRTLEAVALDVGSAINGKEVDLLVSSRDKALEFGRQDVEVRVVN